MSEVSREQDYVTGLFERIDVLREQASARLEKALRLDCGTPQSRLERDAAGCPAPPPHHSARPPGDRPE